MIIPSGYGHDLLKENRAAVAFIIDGSDPAVASTAFAAAQSVGQSKGIQIIQRRLNLDPARLPGIDVRPRVWYNPEMKSSHFMIPALMGLILQFLTTFLTALSIVREKEQGTIEQLVVTPIKPVELVLGKVTPYVVVAFFDFLEVLVIGIFWFGVPVHGSLPLLLVLAALFLLTLGQMEQLKMTVYLAQAQAGRVQVGQEARVTVDGYPDHTFAGRVAYVSSRAEFTPKNVQTRDERAKIVYAVKLLVPNPDRALKAGMWGEAEF